MLDQLGVSLHKQYVLTSEIVTALSPSSLVLLAVIVIIGTNTLGTLPMTIFLADLLRSGVGSQMTLVVLFAWLPTVGSLLTAYGSVSTLLILYSSSCITSHRFSFWRFFFYGFVSVCLTSVITIPLMIGLLQIKL